MKRLFRGIPGCRISDLESVLYCRIVYFIHIYTQTKHWLVKDIKIFRGLRQYAKVHVPITRFVPSQIFHNTGNDAMFLIRFPKCVRTKRNEHSQEWMKFMLVWCLDCLLMLTSGAYVVLVYWLLFYAVWLSDLVCSKVSRFYWAFCPWGLESEVTFAHDIHYEQVHEFY